MVDGGGTTRCFLINADADADAAPAPYPDYSAGTLGGAAGVPLPIMSFPEHNGG